MYALLSRHLYEAQRSSTLIEHRGFAQTDRSYCFVRPALHKNRSTFAARQVRGRTPRYCDISESLAALGSQKTALAERGYDWARNGPVVCVRSPGSFHSDVHLPASGLEKFDLCHLDLVLCLCASSHGH
ncbi:uncharacterized protein RSE6_09037 [Rhynchosporium secalis]|uniref:Uncharacterized protein n=1 Tax=Rhynchosporium secalis TaxID=38038 RepID=A0A1E1MI24_RHYSE|nr:uncharacterized protein RSE6_09037 [Rhynchosporium secalis]